MKIQRTGAGSVETTRAVRDTAGTGLLPLQVDVEGTASFVVNGRVSPDAPWVEIRASSSTGFLESISWVPYLQLVVTGTGTVTLWVGDR